MTPFSLSDLGLNEEEIAALGLGETPAAEPAAPEPDEPVMTPFSLSDLGLTADEIAALEGGEAPPEPSAGLLADLEPAAPGTRTRRRGAGDDALLAERPGAE